MGSEENTASSALSAPAHDQKKDENKKSEILLDYVKRRYDGERQRTTDLDSKAGGLIGYVTIVTGLLVGLGTFSLLEKLSTPHWYIPYFLGIGSLLLAILMSLAAVKTRVFYSTPAIEDLERYYQEEDYMYQRIANHIIPTMLKATEDNARCNNSKAGFVLKSWICLVIGICGIVVYAGVVIGTNDTEKTEFNLTIEGNSTAIRETIERSLQPIVDEATKKIGNDFIYMVYYHY